jgi:hypothetical protein
MKFVEGTVNSSWDERESPWMTRKLVRDGPDDIVLAYGARTVAGVVNGL